MGFHKHERAMKNPTSSRSAFIINLEGWAGLDPSTRKKRCCFFDVKKDTPHFYLTIAQLASFFCRLVALFFDFSLFSFCRQGSIHVLCTNVWEEGWRSLVYQYARANRGSKSSWNSGRFLAPSRSAREAPLLLRNPCLLTGLTANKTH